MSSSVPASSPATSGQVASAALDAAFADSVKNIFRVLLDGLITLPKDPTEAAREHAAVIERARKGLMAAEHAREGIASMIHSDVLTTDH